MLSHDEERKHHLEIIADLALEKGHIVSSFMKNRDAIMEILFAQFPRMAFEMASPSEAEWMLEKDEAEARYINASTLLELQRAFKSAFREELRIGAADISFHQSALLRNVRSEGDESENKQNNSQEAS